MIRALVRGVPASLVDCQVTWIARPPIDIPAARAEHAAYRQALRDAGLEVIELSADETTPDCPFVEDIALDLGEGPRILTRPGTPSRTPEREAVGDALRALGPVVEMPEGLTLDGGDVLWARGTVFVGRSTRTSEDGIAWLRDRSARPVVPVDLHGVLHLKTGVTALDDDTLLTAPGAVDLAPFADFEILEHPEPNVVRLPDRLLARPATAAVLRRRGYPVVEVAIPELARAEAGLTCLSVVLHPRP